MEAESDMARVRAVKARYEKELLRKKNVVGVGIGLRERGGVLTDQVVLTVMVRQKEALSQLRRRDIIPAELDGVPVDVKQVGVVLVQGGER